MSRNKREGWYFGKINGVHRRAHGAKWYLKVIATHADGTVLKAGRS